MPNVDMPPWARLLLSAVGAGSYVAGVVAVFKTGNGAGTAALLTIGGLLLVLGVMGQRVESIKVGELEFKLQAAVEAIDKIAVADQQESIGNASTAKQLRSEARRMLRIAGFLDFTYLAETLEEDEVLVLEKTANFGNGFKSVGGKLVLTNKRLMFQPLSVVQMMPRMLDGLLDRVRDLSLDNIRDVRPGRERSL